LVVVKEVVKTGSHRFHMVVLLLAETFDEVLDQNTLLSRR
jgi:hypothetical protein